MVKPHLAKSDFSSCECWTSSRLFPCVGIQIQMWKIWLRIDRCYSSVEIKMSYVEICIYVLCEKRHFVFLSVFDGVTVSVTYVSSQSQRLQVLQSRPAAEHTHLSYTACWASGCWNSVCWLLHPASSPVSDHLWLEYKHCLPRYHSGKDAVFTLISFLHCGEKCNCTYREGTM